MKSYNYKQQLFDLLPQLYHIWDKDNGSLKAFIESLGETLDDMEQNISELHKDSFIESCHDWVIPYIGQLIGARLVGKDGQQQRREVMKTINWRKRKGTLSGLEDMVREISGWGVFAVEFFEQLGWSQNLNHIKLDHLQSPDLTDEKNLFHLGGPQNTILHTIDIRKPCTQKGWFQIKNIGFFLSSIMLSHYRKIPMRRISGRPNHFALEPQTYPVNIFDGKTRFPISKTLMPQERFKQFGLGKTIDVFSNGVLVATPQMPVWKGSAKVAPPHPDLLNIKDNDGIYPVDWRINQGEPLKYTITAMVLYEQTGNATLDTLGSLDLSDPSLTFNKTADGSGRTNGRLILRIVPDADYNRAFPGMILKLVSHNQTYKIFPGLKDRQQGIYQDRMYCYLPEFQANNEKYFLIDRYGSAYEYIHDSSDPQPEDEDLYDHTTIKCPTQGVCYPSRQLTASTQALSPIYSLSKNHSIEVVDRGQFTSALVPLSGWTIKAWNRDNQPGGGVLRLLSSINITSLLEHPEITSLETHACEQPGHLIISLHREAVQPIPEMEVIITNERGKSILVYLPQVDSMEIDGAFFFVASDGATYRVNSKSIPGGLIVERTPDSGLDGAFNPELLGKYSAGQVLGIKYLSPIQHRIPVRCDLNEYIKPHAGIMAIDPNIGRISFAHHQKPKRPLHASFYHGFSDYVGAGAYFHNWDIVDESRIIHVCKQSDPEGNRHLRPPDPEVISKIKIFSTLQEAFDEVLNKTATCPNKVNPWVIQIEDSEIYKETIIINKAVPCGLIIRAAEFKRPVWRGRLIWNGPADQVTPLVAIKGLLLRHSFRFRTGRFKEIQFKDCTLLRNLFMLKALHSELDRYPKLTIDNCILRRRITVNSYCQISISNSALDSTAMYALAAKRGETQIERCTVIGRIRVKTLHASESIFIDPVTVINSQKGCVRYSRIAQSGNTLPRLYKYTKSPVSFCSDLPWKSAYLKLKRQCNEDVVNFAENGGEIGVYHQADYTLKQKNLRMKFEEYLPVGLEPVLIDIGCKQ